MRHIIIIINNKQEHDESRVYCIYYNRYHHCEHVL
jgi:hypothetical protein